MCPKKELEGFIVKMHAKGVFAELGHMFMNIGIKSEAYWYVTITCLEKKVLDKFKYLIFDKKKQIV